MKTLNTIRWTLACLTIIALSFGLLSKAEATSISLNSDLISESNSVTGTNQAIGVAPVWHPNGSHYFWISYADTGMPGTISPPNVLNPITLPNPHPPTAVFYEFFTLPSSVNTGEITVWADDTTRVYIDRLETASLPTSIVESWLLIDANPLQDHYCADGAIGCTTNESAIFDLSALNLPAGSYQIRLEAYQRAGGPFGVMYTGSVSSEEVPEPATLFLFGAGLATLILMYAKSKHTTLRPC